MPESVVLQGVTSSMLMGHSVQIHTTLSALFLSSYTLLLATALYSNSKFGNGLHVIPGFHTPL